VASAYGYPPEDFPGIEVSRRLSLSVEKSAEGVLEMGKTLIEEGTGEFEETRRRRTEAESTLGMIVTKAQQAGGSSLHGMCLAIAPLY